MKVDEILVTMRTTQLNFISSDFLFPNVYGRLEPVRPLAVPRYTKLTNASYGSYHVARLTS